MSPDDAGVGHDVRILAQERLLDALLRVLGCKKPGLLDKTREILIATEFTHVGKHALSSGMHAQIRDRLLSATQFCTARGVGSNSPFGEP